MRLYNQANLSTSYLNKIIIIIKLYKIIPDVNRHSQWRCQIDHEIVG